MAPVPPLLGPGVPGPPLGSFPSLPGEQLCLEPGGGRGKSIAHTHSASFVTLWLLLFCLG